MNKMWAIISVMLAMGLIMAAPSRCQEKEEPKTGNIDGNIVSADWEKSIITVKWLSSSGELTYQEKVIYVPEGLKISKGGDTIGLMDIEIGDHVIIEYDENAETATAKSIIVED